MQYAVAFKLRNQNVQIIRSKLRQEVDPLSPTGLMEVWDAQLGASGIERVLDRHPVLDSGEALPDIPLHGAHAPGKSGSGGG